MTRERPRERAWLRPLGLLALAFTLAVGQPLVLMVVAFAMLTFLAPGGRILVLLVTAAAFAVVFSGEPTGGLWYLERGWAILVAGWFVALSLYMPDRPFLTRALPAVVGGLACVAVILLASDGWSWLESLVAQRVELSVSATVQMMDAFAEGDLQSDLADTLAMTARVQAVLFPALLGLSSLASLGVAWWLHVRVSARSGPALRSLKEFRFADPLIWVLISGLLLVVSTEWSVGWGRVGTNLVAFMGALYVLRGVAVLLVFWGGLSIASGILFALAFVLAGPLVAVAAMLIGVGDSWLDLRTRVLQRGRGD